jgi:hypothetical protein
MKKRIIMVFMMMMDPKTETRVKAMEREETESGKVGNDVSGGSLR